MSFTRRQALAWGAGGAVTLLGVRALETGAVSLGTNPGTRAWADWHLGRYGGQLALVSAGLLAASPHNTQPWRFAVSRFGVDLFEDPARHLAAMDPFGRERLAGLGAALHNMALASTRIGRSAVVRLLPDPQNPQHIARINLGPATEAAPPPHPLLPAISRRHTHRGAYTGAPISPDHIRALLDFPRPPHIGVHLFEAAQPIGQRFAALTLDATAAITQDTAMMAASHHWFRHNLRIAHNLKDGLTVETSGTPPLLAALATLGPELSAQTEGRYWLAATQDTHLPTATLFGTITAENPHDRRQAIQVGMAWQRLHLIATSLGLAAQPLNQLPEIIDRARQLGTAGPFAPAMARLLPQDPRPTSFAFRLGHAPAPARASLRRPVSQVLGPPARLGYEIDRAAAETAAKDAELTRRLANGQ